MASTDDQGSRFEAIMNITLPSHQLRRDYYELLLTGDRIACRNLINVALAGGISPFDLLNSLIWPTMELLQEVYREDRISISQLNMATRLNRYLTDQLTPMLPRKEPNGRSVLIVCGDDEPDPGLAHRTAYGLPIDRL
jgi:methanogenic corrinoid protein MtbC1